MSVNRLIEIVCDSCRESESEWNTTVASLRRTLRDEHGWRHSNGNDICGTCQPPPVSHSAQ